MEIRNIPPFKSRTLDGPQLIVCNPKKPAEIKIVSLVLFWLGEQDDTRIRIVSSSWINRFDLRWYVRGDGFRSEIATL